MTTSRNIYASFRRNTRNKTIRTARRKRRRIVRKLFSKRPDGCDVRRLNRMPPLRLPNKEVSRLTFMDERAAVVFKDSSGLRVFFTTVGSPIALQFFSLSLRWSYSTLQMQPPLLDLESAFGHYLWSTRCRRAHNMVFVVPFRLLSSYAFVGRCWDLV